MKKIISFTFILFFVNSFAINPIKKNKKLIINESQMFYNSSCDDNYNSSVAFATDFLIYNTMFPPPGANKFYYDSIWSHYNFLIKAAESDRKMCKSIY